MDDLPFMGEITGYQDAPERKAALSQEDIDRYIVLSKAYLGGIQLPFEIQLAAYEEEGEEPTDIQIDHIALGGMSVIDFLKEIVPLRARKSKYGVARGVDDPEAMLEIKKRAVIVYTRCILELAEGEMHEESKPRLVYFPAPDGAKLGRNGYISLFPGYPDSPVGMFRGDGAAFNSQEVVEFVSKHFPDVEDEIAASIEGA